MKGRPMFSGQKTYIVGAVALITAVAGYMTGDLTLAEALQAGFTAVMAATIRHGISTK